METSIIHFFLFSSEIDESDVMDNLSFIKKVDKSHEGFYVCNASNEGKLVCKFTTYVKW
jgi:hypothetical protein